MEVINQDFERVYDAGGFLVGFVALNKKHYGKFAKLPMELFYEGRYLTQKAKWVYATLVSFKNNKTGATFPSYEKIMERSGINRKGDITDALNELERFGWIDRTRRFGQSNDYLVECPVVTLEDGTTFRPIRPTPVEAENWKNSLRKKNEKYSEYVPKKAVEISEIPF